LEALPTPKTAGARFVDGFLDVAEVIDHDGQPIGLIQLRANLNEVHAQLWHYAAIIAAMMSISLGCSILLSRRFQRLIAVPIVNLADAAKRVRSSRDYGIRVVKSANDELGELYDQFNAMLEQIQHGEAAIQKANDQLEMKVEQRTAELSRTNEVLSREVAVRVQAEHELEATHQKLLETARRAGMAEIATGVLHNVGNVLNSVNVSATLVQDRIRQSKVGDLVRAMNLLDQHTADLATFITNDPKGKQLPTFLKLLSRHLADERADIDKELELLSDKVAHVKAIVATQQSYAGVSGLLESVDLSSILDDAIQLNNTSFERHRIVVEKQFADLPPVLIDKQKVLQILVNVLKNAREAFDDLPDQRNRRVTVQTAVGESGMLQIAVSDNAIGIAPADLTRIFSHGFTTKKTGHGFGLHSCANAAAEMKGSLTVASEGLGRGATFVLEIPFQPVEVPAHI
jgi:C4-dicarboxylate-specific signal transduction histidine kinase